MSLKWNASTFTRADALFGGASLLLLIFYFLSWYTYSAAGATAADCASLGVSCSFSVSASTAGGFRILILLLCILALLYTAAKGLGMTARIPLPDWQIMAGIGGLNLLLVIIAFLAKPGAGLDLAAAGVKSGWAYGAFIGLILAIAAAAGAYWQKVGAPALMTGTPKTAGGAAGAGTGGGWG